MLRNGFFGIVLTLSGVAFGSFVASPAFAQFEIKSPKVEKGELEVEQHSSFQRGLPEDDEARHGHEVSVGYGFTNFWNAEISLSFEKGDGESFQTSELEFENTFQLAHFSERNITLGFLVTGVAGLHDEPDAIEFGPLVQFGGEERHLILNGIFEKTFGDNREEGMGFEYAAQLRFANWNKFGFGVEAFGEIENIEKVRSFNEEQLRVGPVVYYDLISGEDKSIKDDDDDDDKKGGSHGPEKVTTALGVLFGASDATPDVTLKWDVEVEF
jgi:hypothetical protein